MTFSSRQNRNAEEKLLCHYCSFEVKLRIWILGVGCSSELYFCVFGEKWVRLQKSPQTLWLVVLSEINRVFFFNLAAIESHHPQLEAVQQQQRSLQHHSDSAHLQDFGLIFAAWIVIESLRIWSVDSRHGALPQSTGAETYDWHTDTNCCLFTVCLGV